MPAVAKAGSAGVALSIAIVLALATALPAHGAKPSKLPTQLWQKYPLGTKRLAPLVKTKKTPRVRVQAPRGSKLAPRVATPPLVPVGAQGGRGHVRFPWIVLAVVLVLSIPAVFIGASWRHLRRG